MYSILSVDDEPANQYLISSALKSDFRVSLASNGEEAIRFVKNEQHDLVLLDVNMPVLDGLETCRLIRDEINLEQLPVIFISASSRMEDKLMAYEVGGNDYIVKPILLPELSSKINVLLQQKKLFGEVQASLNDTRQAMFSAINYAGELGSVIQFFERSFGSDKLEELAEAIFAASAEFGLSVSVQFRVGGDNLTLSSNKISTPLETELLSQGQFGRRIITVGNKSIYNAESVSILVKNMPVEDQELCGRIRDHLAIILRACEAQLELIFTRVEAKTARNRDIDRLCDKLMADFVDLNGMLDDYQADLESMYDDFRLDFKEAALMCDLDREQASILTGSLARLFETRDNVEVQKQTIRDAISEVTNKILAVKEQ